MGSSTYDPTTYTRRVTDAHERGADLFTHTADIRQGRVASGVHEKLNPASLNRLGRNVRESRDSEAHPVSNAVAVMFDVTGSMAGVPRTFIEKLDKLMGLLVRKTYLPDPQILFGAVGDVKSDRSPLQVGQFESGNEMDEALSLIHLARAPIFNIWPKDIYLHRVAEGLGTPVGIETWGPAAGDKIVYNIPGLC